MLYFMKISRYPKTGANLSASCWIQITNLQSMDENPQTLFLSVIKCVSQFDYVQISLKTIKLRAC